MRHLRVFLTLTLTLLLLGSRAWLLDRQTSAEDFPPPAGLSAAGWQAIQSQIAKLAAADGAADDWFGYSVSVDGDTAVVGATYADVGGNANQGAAYVFYRDQGGSWGQVAKLTTADGAAYDIFGHSISVSGDTAVVGAERADVGGNANQGAAYVFYRDLGGADAWGQAAKLTATDGTAEDTFGWSASVDGDTVVVGAIGVDIGGNDHQGAAYVFFRDQGGPGAWGQVAKLTAADGTEGDGFGVEVSVESDTAIVGARLADVGGNGYQGAAYVFYRSQGGADAWGQVAKLTAADGATWDRFGSVSLSGDTAVVGAIGAGHINQGAAYVFYRDHGGADAWGQVTMLTAGDGAADDYFGRSVWVDGDTAVVGAYLADIGGDADQGAAYVFHRDRGGADTWGQVAKLTAGDGTANDWFGWSISVSGDMALIGASSAYVGGNYGQGAAYVFSLPRHWVYLSFVVRGTP